MNPLLMPSANPFSVIASILYIGITLAIFAKVFERLGFSRWLALTQLIPVVGMFVLGYAAFMNRSRKDKENKAESPEALAP